MKRSTMRGLLLAVAMLTALAVAAAPAQATITPVNTTFSGTSSTTQLRDNQGNTVACTTADGTGRSAADGRSISLSLTFGKQGGRCTARTALGSGTAVVDCGRGLVTLRSTSSVAGRNASGTITLDADFSCSVTATVFGISVTINIRGLQTPTNCTWTLDQASQSLTVNCRTIAITSSTGATSAEFTGSYAVRPAFRIS